MDPIEAFFEAYHKEYPQAKNGEVTLEEFQKFLADFQEKENNQSLDHFDGLSPYQMHILLTQPLSEECLLQFGESLDQYTEKVPLFKLSELLLNGVKSQPSTDHCRPLKNNSNAGSRENTQVFKKSQASTKSQPKTPMVIGWKYR